MRRAMPIVFALLLTAGLDARQVGPARYGADAATASTEDARRVRRRDPRPASILPTDVGSPWVATLPVAMERRYRMSARVRPLPFRVGRGDMGEARMTWRGERSGDFGMDLLIGSDPDRAPGFNQWAYVAEESRGGDARTLTVMKRLEETADDTSGTTGAQVFETIASRVVDGRMTSGVFALAVSADFTYRDVSAVLAITSSVGANTAATSAPLPAAVRPGFLQALDDLLQNSSVLDAAARRVTFAHSGRIYDLSAHVASPPAPTVVEGHTFTAVATTEFEIVDPATQVRKRFSVAHGTEGVMKGVPVRVTFQPRWWLEVNLTVTPDGAQ
jgi:hypothetical protein